MPTDSRAIRVARKTLHETRAEIPVPVEQIAKRFAVILRRPLPQDISGMLVPLPAKEAEQRWAIIVNKTDVPVRQRFTIAHELGHLLLHKYSEPHADGRFQVRFRDEKSTTGSVREEIEANQFAAELLMPERLVRRLATRLRFDIVDPNEDTAALRAIRLLAQRFGVSVQALSFRVANLNIG